MLEMLNYMVFQILNALPARPLPFLLIVSEGKQFINRCKKSLVLFVDSLDPSSYLTFHGIVFTISSFA